MAEEEERELDFNDPNFPLKYTTESQLKELRSALDRTRAQRVRAALYPETLTADEKIFELAIDPDKPSAVQRLSQPAQELKDAISDVIQYQLDADLTARLLPELTKLLSDSDRDVVRNACELLRDLAQSEAACHVINANPAVVAALGKAANANAPDSKEERLLQEAATLAFCALCAYPAGRLTLFKTGGIVVLVKLLSAPADRVVAYALTTLHGLIMYQDGARLAVRAAGGIQKMASLLAGKDAKVLAVDLDCLHLLLFGDDEAKLAFYNSRAHKDLVKIMVRFKEQKLLWMTSRLIKVLSTCEHNKDSLVKVGGGGVLLGFLKANDDQLMLNCLSALRNMSDAETAIPIDKSDLELLLHLLEQGDEQVVLLTAGFLANLSCERSSIKKALFEIRGMERLLKKLMVAKRDDLVAPLVCCVRHLTSSHRLQDECEAEFRRLGGLELIVQVLQIFTTWPVLKATSDVIRNVAGFGVNQRTFVDLKVVQRLAQIAEAAIQQQKELLSTGKPKTTLDEVSMCEMCESALLAIHCLVERDYAEHDWTFVIPMLQDALTVDWTHEKADVDSVARILLKVVTCNLEEDNMVMRDHERDYARDSRTHRDYERDYARDSRGQHDYERDTRRQQYSEEATYANMENVGKSNGDSRHSTELRVHAERRLEQQQQQHQHQHQQQTQWQDTDL